MESAWYHSASCDVYRPLYSHIRNDCNNFSVVGGVAHDDICTVNFWGDIPPSTEIIITVIS